MSDEGWPETKCERCGRNVEWTAAGVCGKCIRELRHCEPAAQAALSKECTRLRDELAKLHAMIRQSFFVVLGGEPNDLRFIECEDGAGRSVNVGERRERENGTWELGPFAVLVSDDPTPLGTDPNDTEIAMAMLGLVLHEDEMPSELSIGEMTNAERDAVIAWSAACHAEASDNQVEAGPAPECLRRVLPNDHYLQEWRVR